MIFEIIFYLTFTFIVCLAQDSNNTKSINNNSTIPLINVIEAIPNSFNLNNTVFNTNNLFMISINTSFKYLIEIDSCGFEVEYFFYNQTGNEYTLLNDNDLSSIISEVKFLNIKGKYILLFNSSKDKNLYLRINNKEFNTEPLLLHSNMNFNQNTSTLNNTNSFYIILSSTNSSNNLLVELINNNQGINYLNFYNKVIVYPALNTFIDYFTYYSYDSNTNSFGNSICFILNYMSKDSTIVQIISEEVKISFNNTLSNQTLYLTMIGKDNSSNIQNYQPIEINPYGRSIFYSSNNYQSTPYFFALIFTTLTFLIVLIGYTVIKSYVIYKKESLIQRFGNLIN